jgi:hypothetical protein
MSEPAKIVNEALAIPSVGYGHGLDTHISQLPSRKCPVRAYELAAYSFDAGSFLCGGVGICNSVAVDAPSAGNSPLSEVDLWAHQLIQTQPAPAMHH